MLQVESPILSFLLLVLRIPLDFSPNASYKDVEFFETLPEKDFEFVLSKGDGIVIFNLGLVLLPAEVDPILEERDRKEDALGARGISRVEMVLALSTEVVAFHIGATIVQVGVSRLEWPVSEYGVCLKLAILLALNKQF